MGGMRTNDIGFTLVELMVVVLVVGILVTIAVPVYVEAKALAVGKACQANQRSITGAIALSKTIGEDTSAASEGVFAPGGSGWYAILTPPWIKQTTPCPADGAYYYINVAGEIVGDRGSTIGFKSSHALP